MAFHKRNLLEAFQDAGDVQEPQEEAPLELPPDEEPVHLEEAQLPPPPWEREMPTMPAFVPWLALAGVVFVIGIAIGRMTTGGVSAAEEEEGAPAVESAPPDAGIVPREARDPVTTPAVSGAGGNTSPLLDPGNEYTVVVATYGRSAEDFAWATHDHLRAEGFPVYPPVEVGDLIVVLAGAAPESSDLASLEGRIEALERNGRKGIYSDAYRERIGSLIDR